MQVRPLTRTTLILWRKKVASHLEWRCLATFTMRDTILFTSAIHVSECVGTSIVMGRAGMSTLVFKNLSILDWTRDASARGRSRL